MASTDHHRAYWEVTEERTVPAPGARTKTVRMSRAYWGCFDFLVGEVGCEPARLVEIGEEEADMRGMSFEEVFPDNLAYMDREFSKRFGGD